MDVGLFEHIVRKRFFGQICIEFFETSRVEWLCDMHEEDKDKIQHGVQFLH